MVRAKIKDFMMADVITVSSHQSLEEATQLMRDYGVRHLPVEDDKKLVGVLSERDIAMSFSSPHRAHLTVGDAMVTDPYSVDPESSVADVLDVMAANRLGCVIVKGHGDRVLGIFTTTDALMLLARIFENPELLRGLPGVSGVRA